MASVEKEMVKGPDASNLCGRVGRALGGGGWVSNGRIGFDLSREQRELSSWRLES